MNRARVTLVVDVADLWTLLRMHKSSAAMSVERITDDFERFAAVDAVLNATADCGICSRPSPTTPCAICGTVDQAIIERYYQ